MWQELDGLTGLLNQSSYLNKTASFNQDAILMVFDLDDFKDINDQYGHLKGDQCLVEVADSIRNAYFNDGLCYRIGGDEFFVLLNSDADTEACEKRLQKELEKRRKTLAVLPEVSFGSAVFRVGDDINKVKDMADLRDVPDESDAQALKNVKKTLRMRRDMSIRRVFVCFAGQCLCRRAAVFSAAVKRTFAIHPCSSVDRA